MTTFEHTEKKIPVHHDNCLPEWAVVKAQALIGAVRDYDKTAVTAHLSIPEPDLKLVCVTLAAMVDDTKTPKQLLEWNDTILDQLIEARQKVLQQGLRPCGTHAAFVRHKKRGEPVDELCVRGERTFQAARARRERAQIRAERAAS